MSIRLDSVSIATKGYWCGDGPDIVARATQGHVCLIVIIPVAGGGSSYPPSPLWWKRMRERTKIWEREKYTVEEIKADAMMTQIMMEDEEIVDLIIMMVQVIDDADS